MKSKSRYSDHPVPVLRAGDHAVKKKNKCFLIKNNSVAKDKRKKNEALLKVYVFENLKISRYFVKYFQSNLFLQVAIF